MDHINDLFWIILNDPFLVKGEFLIGVEQLRAARGLLGWSQSELARRAGLSLPTVKRFETQSGIRVSNDAQTKLQNALEAAGVSFIEENGGGPGVRLRKRQHRKS